MAEKRKKKAGAGASRARERERLLERAAGVWLPERADVCVLGGGAAGLACAIAAAEAGARVVVLERDLECGRTILATGNGRCNFANADLSLAHYNCPEFVVGVMGESEGDGGAAGASAGKEVCESEAAVSYVAGSAGENVGFREAGGTSENEAARAGVGENEAVDEGEAARASKAALQRILDFFSECGLAWAEEDGRLYPRSRQAASVRNVLLARAERAGVIFACGREVTGAERVELVDVVAAACEGTAAVGEAASEACDDILADCSSAGEYREGRAAATDAAEANLPEAVEVEVTHEAWEVSFTQAWDGGAASLMADAVVFAGGGSSHVLAGELGLPLVADEPVLCALAAQGPVPGMLEALDGRRAHCVASLTRGGRVVHREAGEVLFRPYGVSGIVSFDLSRHVRRGDMLELDLAPEVDAWEVDKLVASRPGDAHALDGILDPAIAAELIKLAGGTNFGGLAWRVAPLVKGLPLRVTGKADEARAQVTRGGISVDACDASTLELYGNQGLFACGEALDVDGACGGYNLAWAWLSGITAGRAACAHAQEVARDVAERKEAAAAAAALKVAAESVDETPGDETAVSADSAMDGSTKAAKLAPSAANATAEADGAEGESAETAPSAANPTNPASEKGSAC